jgi:peptidoglycan/xylan/chitin deacetylase (PgdA/CDA1 family)
VVATSQLAVSSLRNAVWGVDVPIVGYHNVIPDTQAGDVVNITVSKLRRDLLAIKKAGYTTIYFRDLIGYCENGEKIPRKPIIITFDDGYASNYQLVYPMLKSLGMKATIFIIGSNVGRDTDSVMGNPIIPHFSLEEAREMINSGCVDIQMHTYNLHRPDMNMLSIQSVFNSEQRYAMYIKTDTSMVANQIDQKMGGNASVLAYPYGYFNARTEAILRQAGVKATVTTRAGINHIYKTPADLFGLKRIFPAEEGVMELLRHY